MVGIPQTPADRLQAIMTLFEHPLNEETHPSTVTATMIKTPRTGVDANTAFALSFSKIGAQAILSCSINLAASSPGVTIRCEKGTIRVATPIYNSRSFNVQYFGEGADSGKVIREENKTFEYVGSGLQFEADEVARCIRDGKMESALWGHAKSLLEMTIFDEVPDFFACVCHSC
jgi:predicted dehydrogenase